MNAPEPIVLRQQAHAEFVDGGGVLVLFANGEVSEYPTPAVALRKIKRRDALTARTAIGRLRPVLIVTELTWHNCPEGFDPAALR